MKNILSCARTAISTVGANHPDAVQLAAAAVRFVMMVAEGTIGTGHPAVVGVCAAVSLAVDYLALRLTR
ncbi:MAG: hypothetical protein ACLQDY_09705 [Streptosporangiaceae bacterium]